MTRAFCNLHLRSNAMRDMALGRQGIPDGINIATICPDETDPKVERLTRDTLLLKAAAIASAKRTLNAFGYLVDEFIELLRPHPAVELDETDGRLTSSEEESPPLTSSSSGLQLRY